VDRIETIFVMDSTSYVHIDSQRFALKQFILIDFNAFNLYNSPQKLKQPEIKTYKERSMNMANRRIATTTYLSEDLREMVRQQAARENRSMARQIEQLVWEGLERRGEGQEISVRRNFDDNGNVCVELPEDDPNPFDIVIPPRDDRE
jgi:hypothetical protein